MDPQTFIKEIDEENYRRKKMNALYNQYLKDVGYTAAIRLYEDPDEVTFSLPTVAANVDYNNDLRNKLLKIVGFKNMDYVINLVDTKLNDIQVREMVQNWPAYEAFIKRFVS
jgi:hypothetical protein